MLPFKKGKNLKKNNNDKKIKSKFCCLVMTSNYVIKKKCFQKLIIF